MIAVICSQCNEGFLGLDDDNCTFKAGEVIQSKQFFKLTPIGWSAMKLQDAIECPACKTPSILKDIQATWREEKDRRSKK